MRRNTKIEVLTSPKTSVEKNPPTSKDSQMKNIFNSAIWHCLEYMTTYRENIRKATVHTSFNRTTSGKNPNLLKVPASPEDTQVVSSTSDSEKPELTGLPRPYYFDLCSTKCLDAIPNMCSGEWLAANKLDIVISIFCGSVSLMVYVVQISGANASLVGIRHGLNIKPSSPYLMLLPIQ